MIKAKTDQGNPKYSDKQRKDLEKFLRSMAVFDMTIGYATIHAALSDQKGQADPSAVAKTSDELAKHMVNSVEKQLEVSPDRWSEDEDFDERLMEMAGKSALDFYDENLLEDENFDPRDNPGIPLLEKALEEKT